MKKYALPTPHFPFPLFSLILLILAYGLYIGYVGFYWDDWVWIWHTHQFGSQALLEIDTAFRPLAGIFLWLGSLICGEDPMRWQILALVLRWFSAITCWWAIRKIWPEQETLAAATATLVMLFPGFSQQFVAVNSSRHILPLSFYILSLGFMALSIHHQSQSRRRLFYLLSILLAFATMMTTEYFYGLELVRPLLVWVLYRNQKQEKAIGKTLLYWLPYFMMVAAIFGWRYSLSSSMNYRISLVSSFLTSPWETFTKALTTISQGFLNALVLAWANLLKFPKISSFGAPKTIFFWIMVLSSTLFAFSYFFIGRQEEKESPQPNPNWQYLWLGAAACLLSILPFWIANIEPKFSFPSDRAFLAMGVGSSLFLAGLILFFAKRQFIQAILFSTIIGLAVGIQFQYAIQYRDEWRLYGDLFEQLAWRAPVIEEDTVLITREFPLSFSSDNSLISPLNWLYMPNQQGETDLQLGLYYTSERLGTKIPDLTPGVEIDTQYRAFEIHSSTDRALLVYWEPPNCVRILHPIYDQYLPYVPADIHGNLNLSNLDLISKYPTQTEDFLSQVFGMTQNTTWCAYFQKADLARQFKDWDKIVSLADQAFEQEEYVKNATERIPFIQGYAFSGDFKSAYDLTLESMKFNSYANSNKTQRMFCEIWLDIAQNTTSSSERDILLNDLDQRMSLCSILK